MLLLNDYHLGDLINKCGPFLFVGTVFLSNSIRCDAETRQIMATLTYEELVTSQNGMTISRALVNVIIDQQIGQQISVRNCCGYFVASTHTVSGRHCQRNSSASLWLILQH